MLQLNLNENNMLLTNSLTAEKFTTEQWTSNNEYRLACSKKQRSSADRLISEVKRIVESAAEKARANKEETDYYLKEKIKNIEFSKNEIFRIQKDIALEIDALLVAIKRISNTLNIEVENAESICKKCLFFREHRLGIDLVYDEVYKELHKENELIQKIKKNLFQVFEQSQEQVRKLKSILYHMSHDLESKEYNLKIHQENLNSKESYSNLRTLDNGPFDHNSITTLDEWEMQWKEIILTGTKEINTANTLRSYIHKSLTRSADDLNKQKKLTDEALMRRIEQTSEAKIKLEHEHSEIIRQTKMLGGQITNLEKSITEKESSMAFVFTQLNNCNQNDCSSSLNDTYDTSLITEVVDQRNIVSELQRKLCEAQTCMRSLFKTQIQLEEDINIKTNTLKIDEVDCLTLRQILE